MSAKDENIYKVAGIIGLVVILAIVVMQSFMIVEPGYRGVSVTLGKVDPNYRAEGLSFKMPFIEQVYEVPVKQITVNGHATSFSSDLQNINVDYSVLYRLPQDKVVELFQKFQGDPYQTLVKPRLQAVIKEISSQYRAEELVKSREEMKNRVLERLREDVEGLVYIADVPITNLKLTDELEAAIEKKQIMEQEALAKKYELQREERQAEITLVKAEAEAKAVRIKGEALRASPEIIELEIAQKWDGKAPQSVVTTRGGSNVLLPLKP